MSVFLSLLVFLAMLSVLAVLVIGIISMIKGGEFNKKYGNQLMQARVILQGIALILLAIIFFSAAK
jgi:hypothetical protein